MNCEGDFSGGLMARAYTQEEREKLKADIVAFVRMNGRVTLQKLVSETGVAMRTVRRLCGSLAAGGDIWLSGYGVFSSEQARKDWQNARKKLSRKKAKKPTAVDPDLIWSLPDGEIRRYDRRLNIICLECRKSEVMQRVLAFYRGNFRDTQGDKIQN